MSSHGYRVFRWLELAFLMLPVGRSECWRHSLLFQWCSHVISALRHTESFEPFLSVRFGDSQMCEQSCMVLVVLCHVTMGALVLSLVCPRNLTQTNHYPS